MLNKMQVGLMILVLICGGYFVASLRSSATAQTQIESLAQDVNKQTEQTLKVETSAEITQTLTADNHKTETVIERDLQKQLSELKKIPAVTITKEPQHEASEPSSSSPATTNWLSPQLRKLLDNSYCEGNADDSYCTSR